MKKHFVLLGLLLLVMAGWIGSCGSNVTPASSGSSATVTPTPTVNQVTIEVSNQSGSSCPVTVNLDGNNTVLIATGTFYTFPIVTAGSHTLNFSTTGSGCVYNNDNSQSYADTFNANASNVYVGTVKPVTVSGNVQLFVLGP